MPHLPPEQCQSPETLVQYGLSMKFDSAERILLTHYPRRSRSLLPNV